MQNFNKEQAVSLAVSDIGLTPREAIEAAEHFESQLPNVCEDCGVEVDGVENDYCIPCWNKSELKLQKEYKELGLTYTPTPY